MPGLFKGSDRTRAFYDGTGWQMAGTRPVDTELFGVLEDGPIRQALHRAQGAAVARALAPAGRVGRLLEMGCGGNPALAVAALAEHYHGVDFSRTGLELAAARLAEAGVAHELTEADITALPFAAESFDAVYSAHVLYHIDSREGQAAALAEALRVLRPGGTAVLVLANPWPLLFPVRLGRRLVAAALCRGSGSALPYLPLSPGWYARRAAEALDGAGAVRMTSAGIVSVWFNRNVPETRFPGRLLWRLMARLQLGFPRASVRLGNFFMLAVTKPPAGRG
jgi:SAM-dependent methyltransferase